MAEGFEVFAHTIAFVAGEAILRIIRVEFDHQTVAGDLGDDAGGRYAEAQRIALDQRGLIDRQSSHGEPVDQGVVGARPQALDSAGHGEVGGAKDVEAVDFRNVCASGRPEDGGVRGEDGEKFFATGGGDFFRIGQAV